MLSIIIPALNEEKYLPKLLGSIESQNFSDYEIIVADAGSKDATIKIAKKYGCKAIKGGLPAEGRNNGAKHAKGDLLLFLDADMILPDGFLTDFLDKFRKRNLDIATCLILPSDGSNKVDKIGYMIYNYWIRATQKVLPHAAQVILAKGEIHKKVGGFSTKIRIGEDHAYAREANRYGKFGVVKTKPVLTSPRRFEKDGRFKTFSKFILVEAHRIFFGPIKSKSLNYKFGHYEEDER